MNDLPAGVAHGPEDCLEDRRNGPVVWSEPKTSVDSIAMMRCPTTTGSQTLTQ